MVFYQFQASNKTKVLNLGGIVYNILVENHHLIRMTIWNTSDQTLNIKSKKIESIDAKIIIFFYKTL